MGGIMVFNQYIKTFLVIFFASFFVVGCEVVDLDSKGKPIIPMSAEEAASLANKEPKEIAEIIWQDLFIDAEKAPLDLQTLDKQKQNDKSYFVTFSGIVEKIDEKSKFLDIHISTGQQVIIAQAGTIIKGNAIRDASSLLSFDQFKNQIQYSKLAKELNKSAVKNLQKLDQNSLGKKVNVLAALTIKDNQIHDVVPMKIQIVE